MDAEANLAWDRSGRFPGANGRVYLVYTNRDLNSVDTNIFVRTSNDGGATWSAATPVHQPSPNSQFLPAIAVDQVTGNVAVTWYDADQSPNNNTAQIWGTVSVDGGATYLPDVQIGAGLSDVTGNPNNTFDFGDYTQVDFFNGYFYPVWADNANPSALFPRNTNLPRLDLATAAVAVLNPAPFAAFKGSRLPTRDWSSGRALDLRPVSAFFGAVGSVGDARGQPAPILPASPGVEAFALPTPLEPSGPGGSSARSGFVGLDSEMDLASVEWFFAAASNNGHHFTALGSKHQWLNWEDDGFLVGV